MRKMISALFVLALCASTAPLLAQQGAPSKNAFSWQGPTGPVQGNGYHTQYLWLDQHGEGLLYEPTVIGPKAQTVLLMAQNPNVNIFTHPVGREMVSRGYRVLIVNFRGEDLPEAPLPSISRGIAYVRSLPGVKHVVLIGHSGGGRQILLYANIAAHGPSACQKPDMIYPCRGAGLDGLQKPDGLIVLDTPPWAFHIMSGLDPAVDGNRRNPALDMYAPANGYDPVAKRATYSAAFTKRYYAAQAARNAKFISQALDRLHAITEGKGDFSDDEPLFIRGMPTGAVGTRLLETDTAFVSHTKEPHTLLRADGTETQAILRSVRLPVGQDADYAEIFGKPPPSPELLSKLNSTMNLNTTVRHFLANDAIRTTADYAITDDDIIGVDWHSAYDEAVGNAEGVTVPVLLEANTCHYSPVFHEIIYDHLAAKDKTLVGLEGANHNFAPCRPQYGDTTKRLYDYLDQWLSKTGRF